MYVRELEGIGWNVETYRKIKEELVSKGYDWERITEYSPKDVFKDSKTLQLLAVYELINRIVYEVLPHPTDYVSYEDYEYIFCDYISLDELIREVVKECRRHKID
ncbi:MAG: hypothetical protein QXT00_08800 [Ignisphaera sp.]